MLLLTRAALAALLDGREIRLQRAGRPDADQPLPATLNNYSLHFKLGA